MNNPFITPGYKKFALFYDCPGVKKSKLKIRSAFSGLCRRKNK